MRAFILSTVAFAALALAVPALIALGNIRAADIAVPPPHTTRAAEDPVEHESIWQLLRDRRLAAFAACIVLFQLGNAAADSDQRTGPVLGRLTGQDLRLDRLPLRPVAFLLQR